MDVLRPPLIRIGGRVYRKNLIQEQPFPHEEEEEFCADGDMAVVSCFSSHLAFQWIALSFNQVLSIQIHPCLCWKGNRKHGFFQGVLFDLRTTQQPADESLKFLNWLPEETIPTVWELLKLQLRKNLACPGECADEPCDAFVVEETERGFQCRLEVPSPLYKYIIGKKGETKKRLETETRTSISIPKPGVEGEIVITGQQRSGVISARTRLEVLLDSFRRRQPFTHFLSLPLNQPAIQQNFLHFKEEVLHKCSKDHGVSSSLFQNPAKLHLTIGTLVLLNEQEIQRACDLLQQCKEDFVDQITGGQPLTVEVAGVEYMNDDPAMTDVLYAKVHMKDGSDRLQMLADQLVERFVASGLMLKEWDRVKLHATVMNTLFRKDPTEERNNTMPGKSSFKERESFNGQNILKLFENFHFGEVQLDSVRLSQRFSSDASGYYATSGQLCFS